MIKASGQTSEAERLSTDTRLVSAPSAKACQRGAASTTISAERARLPTWPWVICGAGILALPAVLNGQAFLYFDSAAYMTLPRSLVALLGDPGAGAIPALSEESLGVGAEPHRGRALAYRLVGWTARSTGLGLWPLVAAQAVVVAMVLAMLWRVGTGRALDLGWLVLVAVLGLTTPLGLFVGMVMPDVFSGLLIVAAGLMVLCWSRLGFGERWFLGLLATWAMMVHTSHVALGAVLLVALTIAAFLGMAVAWRGLGVLALGLLGTLAVEVGIGFATVQLSESPLLTRPHVTANLVDRGPGTDFLRRACPNAGFVLCDYLDRLPMPWIDFLFSRNPETGLYQVISSEARAALAAEHGRFAFAVLADDPLRFAGFTFHATFAQLVDLRSADAVISPSALANMDDRLMPADQLERLRNTPLIRNFDWLLAVLDTVTYVSMFAALAVLIAVPLSRQRMPSASPASALVLVLLFGLLANAAICGVLAGVYGRFQGRIVWLLPMAAALFVPLLLQRMRRPTTTLSSSTLRSFPKNPPEDAA